MRQVVKKRRNHRGNAEKNQVSASQSARCWTLAAAAWILEAFQGKGKISGGERGGKGRGVEDVGGGEHGGKSCFAVGPNCSLQRESLH